MSTRVRLLLCAAVLALGGIQTALAFSRSLIPYAVDGELQEVRVVGDSRQRLFKLEVDGRSYEIDNPRLADIRLGRHLKKNAWSTTIEVDGRQKRRLPVGDEAFQFAGLTILAAGGMWRLTSRRVPQGQDLAA